MPKPQRKEEILKSELPPTLPLMALRSTIVAVAPGFGEYQAKTTRVIPLFELTRA